MNELSVLEQFRIGCVQYLNALPLIHGYEGKVVYDHPAKLAGQLRAGELDIALVPAFEALSCGGCYTAVDGAAIAADGAVYSVFLAHREPLQRIETIRLDAQSMTSANLLKCLLAEFHRLTPRYVTDECCEAQLLIGNQAIGFRHEHGDVYQYLDLGKEWQRQTGLPFVFALWLLREDVVQKDEAASALRTLRKRGVAAIPEIAAAAPQGYAPEFAEFYLTRCIRYGLGERERQALQLYGELLARHRLIAEVPAPLRFI